MPIETIVLTWDQRRMLFPEPAADGDPLAFSAPGEMVNRWRAALVAWDRAQQEMRELSDAKARDVIEIPPWEERLAEPAPRRDPEPPQQQGRQPAGRNGSARRGGPRRAGPDRRKSRG